MPTVKYMHIRRKSNTRICQKNLSQFSAQWNLFENWHTNVVTGAKKMKSNEYNNSSMYIVYR